MDVKFTDEELMGAITVLLNRMADESGLSDKDRAMLKRWRASALKPGSDELDDLVLKANDDFARGLARRERSQLRKPDWRD